jgi:hypothetical protein
MIAHKQCFLYLHAECKSRQQIKAVKAFGMALFVLLSVLIWDRMREGEDIDGVHEKLLIRIS